MTSDLQIVPVSLLTGLQARAKLWWIGWLLGIGMSIVSVGTYYRTCQLMSYIDAVSQQQLETQQLQRDTATGLIQAWEQQQAQTKSLISWGEYVKSREALVKYNQKQPKSFKDTYK